MNYEKDGEIYSKMNDYSVRLYNRALTEGEILSNYNAIMEDNIN